MQILKRDLIRKSEESAVSSGAFSFRTLMGIAGKTAAEEICKKCGAELFLPPLSLCGDNAAMIGAQAYYEFLAGNTAGMELNAYATKSILGEKI